MFNTENNYIKRILKIAFEFVQQCKEWESIPEGIRFELVVFL